MEDQKKPARQGWLRNWMEAPTRFELVMEVLQTSALPLGDGAVNDTENAAKSSVLISNRQKGVKGKIPDV
jgi:hypothetical protein